MCHRMLLFFAFVAIGVHAQNPAPSSNMKQVLERLDDLEKQNKNLMEQIRLLKEQVTQAQSSATPIADTSTPGQKETPPLDERVAVVERRVAEQAQTKVEAAHKFPIQLTGLVLFNAFANTGGYVPDTSEEYALLSGPNRSGGTLRQSLLGFNFQGPNLPGGGKISGSLMMDFFGGYADPLSIRPRLRRAGVSLDWKNRSFFVGQDKPLIAPYQPDSLAEVGIPPLAGAGNLWLWLPQARYEERIHFGAENGLTAQIAALQTEENYVQTPTGFMGSIETARPALEGRFAFWHKFDDTRRLEVAPGFHVSTSHVGGSSVSSKVGSLDWLFTPASFLKISGTVFKGQNVANLGSLGNGFVVTPTGKIQAVDSAGGWTQFAFPLTSRMTLNLFGGLESDSSAYLNPSSIARNWSYASNLMYHLGPNVIVSFEALQMRTRTASSIDRLYNHFDLALGYAF
jgi:hypothetical protein